MQATLPFDNNALFDPNGHLTDPGLQALVEGTLDELGRLEAGEHLSFCDFCLARYTALIEAMPQCIQAPMRDLVPQVQALMRRRSFQILTNRYVSAAAAVVLAFALWQFGLFGTTAPVMSDREPAGQGTTWSQNVQQTIEDLGNGFHAMLSDFQSIAETGFDQLRQPAAQAGLPTIKE